MSPFPFPHRPIRLYFPPNDYAQSTTAFVQRFPSNSTTSPLTYITSTRDLCTSFSCFLWQTASFLTPSSPPCLVSRPSLSLYVRKLYITLNQLEHVFPYPGHMHTPLCSHEPTILASPTLDSIPTNSLHTWIRLSHGWRDRNRTLYFLSLQLQLNYSTCPHTPLD